MSRLTDLIAQAKAKDPTLGQEIEQEFKVLPHGIQFADALPKLKGLAKYAEANRDSYRRIEAVAKIDDDRYRMLNLNCISVRALILSASSAKSLYSSGVAEDYVG